MEYHIFAGNAGDYHLAAVQDGKCVLWFTADQYDLDTVINTRNDLVNGAADIWDVQGAAENPQEIWDSIHLDGEFQELNV